MSRYCLPVILLVLGIVHANQTFAATIQYGLTQIDGAIWEYSYTLSNDLAEPIEEFTVFYDLALFRDLAVVAAPASWDPLVVQPDAAIPDAGFFDALSLGGGLASGASASGFVVRFTYLGAGLPGAQAFHIVDPVTFNVLDAGMTTVIPLPPAILLLLSGLSVLGLKRRSVSSRGTPS